MRQDMITVGGVEIPVHSMNTVIVGSGAAGLNAADCLFNLGQRDVAIVTEGLQLGTSRNTGSDKQTYYKLTQAGGEPDSVYDMAKTLFAGGAMHGDTALVEAALSGRCYYKLVEAGVPFPHDGFGQYAGYKTDHDPRQRATSAGPLTSKFMVEALEKLVYAKGVKIFEGFQAIAVLTDGAEKAAGLLALDMNNLDSESFGFTLFNCTNIIWATGGPAGIYESSVYPESQFGSLGAALAAGAKGVNLTESQYGIASTKFRWNLSGTYQQVLPRYISTNQNGGDEREFLNEGFPTLGKMLDAEFLKGYQWPFDPRKIANHGSSMVDLLVYREKELRGRRVFMDFTRNPSGLDFRLLGQEAHEYLRKSGALFGTPIERLRHMNPAAIELYRDHGIDLASEPLEIAVCAQHCNGGLAADRWWESNLRHFFPVGEACGSFGVYRPGGSALNSTQVGSLRASQRIAWHYAGEPASAGSFAALAQESVEKHIALARKLLDNRSGTPALEQRAAAQKRMTKSGAHIRGGVEEALAGAVADLGSISSIVLPGGRRDLPEAFRNRDMLQTQAAFLSAILEYKKRGGGSRGSYLIADETGDCPGEGLETLRHRLDDGKLAQEVCEITLDGDTGACAAGWKPVRPLPEPDLWYENVWRQYREKAFE